MSDIARALDRADRAERLLRDDILSEAFDTLKTRYHAEWERASDPVARERNWHCVQSLAAVREHLESIVKTGQIAAHDFEKLKEDRDGQS